MHKDEQKVPLILQELRCGGSINIRIDNEESIASLFDLETNVDDLYEPANLKPLIYCIAFFSSIFVAFILFSRAHLYGSMIVMYILLIICHIVLFVCYLKKKRGKTIHEELNLLFGIKTRCKENIYSIQKITTPYVGSIFFVFTVNVYLQLIVIGSMDNDIFDTCHEDIKYIDKEYNGACLLMTGFNQSWPVISGLYFVMACTSIYVKNDSKIKKMMNKRNILVISNKNKICIELEKKMETLKQKWIDSLSWNHRKKKAICLFIIACIWNAYEPKYLKQDYTNYMLDILIYSWMFITVSLALTFLLYYVHSLILYLQYPLLIMQQFSNSIEGDEIEDFISWWQLRVYYLNNEISLCIKKYNSTLTISVIVSICLIAYIVHDYIFGDREGYRIPYYFGFSAGMKVISFIVLCVLVIYYLGHSAAAFYTEQIQHTKMLKRAKLLIGILNNDNNDNNNEEKKSMILDDMIIDIECNAFALQMVGLDITPTLMKLINGSIITLITSFVGVISANSK